MLEIAPLPKPAILLIIEDLAFFCAEILAQVFIPQQLLQAVSKHASRFVRTDLILEKVAAEFHLELRSWHSQAAWLLVICGIGVLTMVFFLVCKGWGFLFFITIYKGLCLLLLAPHRIEIKY